jgi:hypothetical protein
MNCCICWLIPKHMTKCILGGGERWQYTTHIKWVRIQCKLNMLHFSYLVVFNGQMWLYVFFSLKSKTYPSAIVHCVTCHKTMILVSIAVRTSCFFCALLISSVWNVIGTRMSLKYQILIYCSSSLGSF